MFLSPRRSKELLALAAEETFETQVLETQVWFERTTSERAFERVLTTNINVGGRVETFTQKEAERLIKNWFEKIGVDGFASQNTNGASYGKIHCTFSNDAHEKLVDEKIKKHSMAPYKSAVDEVTEGNLCEPGACKKSLPARDELDSGSLVIKTVCDTLHK